MKGKVEKVRESFEIARMRFESTFGLYDLSGLSNGSKRLLENTFVLITQGSVTYERSFRELADLIEPEHLSELVEGKLKIGPRSLVVVESPDTESLSIVKALLGTMKDLKKRPGTPKLTFLVAKGEPSTICEASFPNWQMV